MKETGPRATLAGLLAFFAKRSPRPTTPEELSWSHATNSAALLAAALSDSSTSHGR
jgi:hypothetical protein